MNNDRLDTILKEVASTPIGTSTYDELKFKKAKSQFLELMGEVINCPDQNGFTNTSPELRNLMRERLKQL